MGLPYLRSCTGLLQKTLVWVSGSLPSPLCNLLWFTSPFAACSDVKGLLATSMGPAANSTIVGDDSSRSTTVAVGVGSGLLVVFAITLVCYCFCTQVVCRRCGEYQDRCDEEE